MAFKCVAGFSSFFRCMANVYGYGYRYVPLVVLVLILPACTHIQLTPITSTPTDSYNPGQVVWHDLITDDVETAKIFYAALLGWDFQQYGNYTVVRNDSIPIGGIVYRENEDKKRRSAGWIPYLSVPDVDNTADWVQTAGGAILKGPGNMVNRGRYATIIDPLMAPLVLLHSISGDPQKSEVPAGGWLWDELWTSDVPAALEFYQELGGYAAQRVYPENDTEYWILIDENDHYRAGITENPFAGLPSQWVPVVRVDNPMDVVMRVDSLGGKVIIHPDHPLSDGSVALIKDPTGGIFIVEAWEPETKAQEHKS